MLLGYQQRHFKIISSGSVLVYYHKITANQQEMDKLRPDGVFEIAKITNINSIKGGAFEFSYGGRKFELKGPNQAEADIWITYLKFLVKLKSKL